MTREEIIIILNDIFSDVFDEDIEVFDEMTAEDIEDWDSLEQMNLITAIQEKFSVKFHVEDIVDLEKVGDMIDLIQKKV